MKLTVLNMREPWNDDEVAILKELYPDNENEVIGNLINRTASAVANKARRLKLQRSKAFAKAHPISTFKPLSFWKRLEKNAFRMLMRWLFLRRWRRSLRVGDEIIYTKQGTNPYRIKYINLNEITVWGQKERDYLSFPIKKAYPINYLKQ